MRNPQCQALTKKGHRCINGVESPLYEGKFLCHLHHPWGTFQLQQIGAKRKRREMKLAREQSRGGRDEQYTEMLASLRRQKGLSDPSKR